MDDIVLFMICCYGCLGKLRNSWRFTHFHKRISPVPKHPNPQGHLSWHVLSFIIVK